MALPALASFPYLYSLLRNDPRANKEFNDYVSQARSPVASSRQLQDLTENLEAERKLRAEQQLLAEKVGSTTKKTVRFIKLLGEVIESQVSLRPYTQDVSLKATYSIVFNAGQIRMALKLFWDVMAQNMEDALTNASAVDPVPDPEDEEG